MGVHTAWGRTLKDVFQRYKALRGFHQRYQNGWDCQGLWIEVGVEKALGLNSKREIEEYGLDRFAEKCREVVAWSSQELRRASQRLGQWMDWERDYYTFSDTNIEYIWRFLRSCTSAGCCSAGTDRQSGARAAAPRCPSTSSRSPACTRSARTRRLSVRLPLLDRPGQAIVVWTTTPWTLPANVAAAVNPELEYGRLASGDWVAVASDPDATFEETAKGSELVGLRYRGPFDDLEPGSGVEHRVIPWAEVALDTGTGIVHIAPGAGREDFELSKVDALPVLTPVDEAGRFYPEYGWLAGHDHHRGRGADHRGPARARHPRARGDRPSRLSALLALRHAADLPHRRRLVHRRRRRPPAAARREREGRVDAAAVRQADGRLAAQHGGLEHLAAALLRPPAARSTRAPAAT